MDADAAARAYARKAYWALANVSQSAADDVLSSLDGSIARTVLDDQHKAETEASYGSILLAKAEGIPFSALDSAQYRDSGQSHRVPQPASRAGDRSRPVTVAAKARRRPTQRPPQAVKTSHSTRSTTSVEDTGDENMSGDEGYSSAARNKDSYAAHLDEKMEEPAHHQPKRHFHGQAQRQRLPAHAQTMGGFAHAAEEPARPASEHTTRMGGAQRVGGYSRQFHSGQRDGAAEAPAAMDAHHNLGKAERFHTHADDGGSARRDFVHTQPLAYRPVEDLQELARIISEGRSWGDKINALEKVAQALGAGEVRIHISLSPLFLFYDGSVLSLPFSLLPSNAYSNEARAGCGFHCWRRLMILTSG